MHVEYSFLFSVVQRYKSTKKHVEDKVGRFYGSQCIIVQRKMKASRTHGMFAVVMQSFGRTVRVQKLFTHQKMQLPYNKQQFD